MAAKPKTIDEYLAAVSDEQRAALEKLRKLIKATAPEADECISYGLAAFRLNGKPLVAFGASPGHCAFYPMNGTSVDDFKAELKGYETSKGTIRFQPDKPLPAALVRKLVKARIAENSGQSADAAKPRAAKKRPASTQAVADPAVSEFMRKLDHPLKKDIATVRKIILGVSPAIHEGIKWNSVSFRTSEFFATVFLRSRDKIQLVFHRGAKVKDNMKPMQIADPEKMIEWLATDRCMVTLGAGKELTAKRSAFEAIVRAWIKQM